MKIIGKMISAPYPAPLRFYAIVGERVCTLPDLKPSIVIRAAHELRGMIG